MKFYANYVARRFGEVVYCCVRGNQTVLSFPFAAINFLPRLYLEARQARNKIIDFILVQETPLIYCIT